MALALLLVFSTACASAVRGGNGSEEVFLEVRNDLVPGRAVTIRAVSSSGTRQVVGALAPNQTRVLRFRRSSFVGPYRFVADVDAEGQVVSISVVLAPGDRLVWALRNNLLRVSIGEGGGSGYALKATAASVAH